METNKLVLMSGQAVKERLTKGLTNVRYFVHLSNTNYYNNGDNTDAHFSYVVKMVEETEGLEVMAEQIINHSVPGLSFKSHGETASFSLKDITNVQGFKDIEFANVGEVHEYFESLCFKEYFSNNELYGIKNWVEVE